MGTCLCVWMYLELVMPPESLLDTSLCVILIWHGNLVSLEHKDFLERDISPLEEGARINDLNGEHSWRRIGLAHFKTQIGPRFSQM